MHKITTTVPKTFYGNHKLSVELHAFHSVWHNLNSDVCTLNLLAQRGEMWINYGLQFKSV